MYKPIVLSFIGIGYITLTAHMDPEMLDARLRSAIAKLDFAQVDNLLVRAGVLEPTYKTILHDDAQYQITAAQKKISLLASKKDRSTLIKWALGSCASGGLAWAVANFSLSGGKPGETQSYEWQWDAKHAASAALYAGAVFSGYFALRGFRCSYAEGRLASACTIAQLIEMASVKA